LRQDKGFKAQKSLKNVNPSNPGSERVNKIWDLAMFLETWDHFRLDTLIG
jgi:hypothetical protein